MFHRIPRYTLFFVLAMGGKSGGGQVTARGSGIKDNCIGSSRPHKWVSYAHAT